ncbi:tellurite resistance TerB family protein [Cereibacter sphaeroides]|uniref:tellurite resistance TerB family protein n=1 Tax=Cereibacter sphaeroides TaxID=1063 RepID=UPI001F480B0D|nr:tellurite resistance TerB family protein [Cereibacter sphaeroides]MCE6957754.1 tellurite resistance TerB family protein [Cereibacter sphaeroides]MCE6971620.1 tellurite resistance TerB family protein [Cereibacter sphaeroides]
MLNWLKTKGTEARAALAAEVTKFKNKTFMEAVVAACALMSAADGAIKPEEKKKMAGFLQNSAELKHFDIKEVIELFEKVTGTFAFDADIGKAEALKLIGRAGGNREQARLVARVAIAIGSSDGTFDEKERAIAADICRELGLDPKEFDV